MPATVQAQFFGASATLPAGANAETGITFNRIDTQTGTTPVPIPVSAGVNFSYLKALCLAVTATSTTTINNRTIRLSGSIASGLGIHWKTVTQANYGSQLDQTSATKAPTDTTGTNNAGTAPSGYTAATTSAVAWEASSGTSQSTSSTGIGTVPLLATLLAVDATYAGGPGSASLGNIVLGYDEAKWFDKLDRDAIAWARDPVTTTGRRDRSCRRRGRGDCW